MNEAFAIGGDIVAISNHGAMTKRAEDAVRQGIDVLGTAVHNIAVAHGWWEAERNMGEMIALMHSELSEALESHRNSEPPLWYKHADPATAPIAKNNWSSHAVNDDGLAGKPEGIASEFADCIIRILDTCKKLDIPVAQALIDKHNYNMTRPYRHGGKVC